MAKKTSAGIETLGLLFEADRRIAAEYRSAGVLLQQKEVTNKLKFLGALDKLAHENDFSARQIINLLKPGFFGDAHRSSTTVQIKEENDRLGGDTGQGPNNNS